MVRPPAGLSRPHDGLDFHQASKPSTSTSASALTTNGQNTAPLMALSECYRSKSILARSMPSSQNSQGNGDIVPNDYAISSSDPDTLRITVKSFTSKNDGPIPQSNATIQHDEKYKVRCTLTITEWRSDAGVENLLYQSSQVGWLSKYASASDHAVTHILLPQPFLVATEQLYVNSPVRVKGGVRKACPSAQAPVSFVWGWSKEYRIHLTFEPRGDESWPPLGLLDRASILTKKVPPIMVKLSGTTTIRKNRASSEPMELRVYGPERESCSASHVINTTITWLCNKKETKVGDELSEVVWTFVNPDGSNEQIAMDGFKCAICEHGQDHYNQEKLKQHLQTGHPQYRFALRQSQVTQGWFIEYHPLQLVHEDKSAVMMDGIDHDSHEAQKSLLPSNQFCSASGKSGESRSNPISEGLPTDSFCHALSAASIATLAEHPSTKPSLSHMPLLPSTVVPITRKPLYHTSTRRILKPGEPMSPPAIRPSQKWRLQEHRDIINDFTDFADDEKEYYIHWDTYMAQQHITADVYLPQALFRFVKVNTTRQLGPDGNSKPSWFTEKESRPRLFGLHTTALQLRGQIDWQVVYHCSMLLTEARAIETARSHAGSSDTTKSSGGMKQEATELPVQAEALSKKRGPTECVCGKVVVPYGATICVATKCRRRYHHTACIEKLTGVKPPKRHWLCSSCAT